MDDLVQAAMRKWPHVPHCHGWLALDARGDWYLRDGPTQAAGPFPTPKGSRVEHAKLRAFIERHYTCDAHGGWYFQNGPQRVYVTLEDTPWVWTLEVDPTGALQVRAHTGQPAGALQGCWTDEHGHLYLHTALGLGRVRSSDMERAADQVLAGHWVPQEIPHAALPDRFGFQRQPVPHPSGHEKADPRVG